VRVWPSAANFLLLRVPDGTSARAGLARRGIAVRRADTFPGLDGNHLRVAVRGPDDNRRLVEALGEVLDERSAHPPDPTLTSAPPDPARTASRCEPGASPTSATV
jgi:hypothetical protein